MKCPTLPEHNLTLTPPHNWDAEKNGVCETVTCLREPDGYTVAFELDQTEFAALLNGGHLKLKIFGAMFPPVALYVE